MIPSVVKDKTLALLRDGWTVEQVARMFNVSVARVEAVRAEAERDAA